MKSNKLTVQKLYNEYCNQRKGRKLSYSPFYIKFKLDMMTFSQLLDYDPEVKFIWNTDDILTIRETINRLRNKKNYYLNRTKNSLKQIETIDRELEKVRKCKKDLIYLSKHI